jgi:hypothetical protein
MGCLIPDTLVDLGACVCVLGRYMKQLKYNIYSVINMRFLFITVYIKLKNKQAFNNYQLSSMSNAHL